jgi:hypothetical protein
MGIRVLNPTGVSCGRWEKAKANAEEANEGMGPCNDSG